MGTEVNINVTPSKPVIAGHSHSKNGVASLAYCTARAAASTFCGPKLDLNLSAQ